MSAMTSFQLLAKPWPVNLLAAIPVVAWLWFRKKKLELGRKQLAVAGLFGTAFGFVEAAVVIDLRTVLGLLGGPTGKLPGGEGQLLNATPVLQSLDHLTRHLLAVEIFREAATMVMLLSIAWLVGRRAKEKVAVFLWAFAFWDLFYYVWFRVAAGWPQSLLTPDVLFLIPVPWLSQVWFPVTVSSLTILAIWFSPREKRTSNP